MQPEDFKSPVGRGFSTDSVIFQRIMNGPPAGHPQRSGFKLAWKGGRRILPPLRGGARFWGGGPAEERGSAPLQATVLDPSGIPGRPRQAGLPCFGCAPCVPPWNAIANGWAGKWVSGLPRACLGKTKPSPFCGYQTTGTPGYFGITASLVTMRHLLSRVSAIRIRSKGSL